MKPQKYGYIDESGSPGIAHGPNDYLLVCMVLFRDYDAARNANARIANLRTRLNLPKHYEFHRAKNSPAIRRAFENLIFNTEFQIIAVAVQKNRFRHVANYEKISELLVAELTQIDEGVKIKMDVNPTLLRNIRKQLKHGGIKKCAD